jgi:beta-glucosidase
VLFGDYNPAGRLVQTWPRALEQLPPLFDYDIRHGRTYMYFEGEPLYPFGHGLSYTSFAYAALATSSDTLSKDGAVSVHVEVTNTGSRSGDEVVQLYVRYVGSAVKRPNLQLCDFARVAFEPGETKRVELALRAEQVSYWDPARQAFVLEAGSLEVLVGPSSAELPLRTRVAVASPM